MDSPLPVMLSALLPASAAAVSVSELLWCCASNLITAASAAYEYRLPEVDTTFPNSSSHAHRCMMAEMWQNYIIVCWKDFLLHLISQRRRSPYT